MNCKDSGGAHWRLRGVPGSLLGLVTLALLVSVVAAGTLEPGSAGRHLPAASGTPAALCDRYAFEDQLPHTGHQVALDPQLTFNVTVGGADYTSYATGVNGARMQDFVDSLDPERRPGGPNLGDVWGSDIYGSGMGIQPHPDPSGGFVRMGGTGHSDPPDPRRMGNGTSLGHVLPVQALSNNFRARVEIRYVAGSGGNYTGGGEAHVGGLAHAGTGQPDHAVYFALGPHGSNPYAVIANIIDDTVPETLWPEPPPGYVTVLTPIQPDPSDGGWHEIDMANNRGYVMATYFQNGANTVVGYLGSFIYSLTHVSLHAMAYRSGMTTVVDYRNFSLQWVTEAQATSQQISLPVGYTRLGTLSIESDNGGGTIQFYVTDATGHTRLMEVSDGADLSAFTPPIRLQARLHRDDLDAQSPAVLRWAVLACKDATPTPTPTGTAAATRTPTATGTPRPTSTPRPTATPRPYFEVAPLKPAVHLKVDAALEPPAAPDDQTDWRESDPLWYPLQVYAGLVPFAYPDPASPPRLCYWTQSGWRCADGAIALKSYTLRDIEMDGRSYLDAPVTVGYARAHRYMQWRDPLYRFEAPEYAWVSWLAPDGVVPQCAAGQRCLHVAGVAGGVSFIVYDVDGTIHWDAIPGVGGPYDYAFTNNYRVPISLVYPRVEP